MSQDKPLFMTVLALDYKVEFRSMSGPIFQIAGAALSGLAQIRQAQAQQFSTKSRQGTKLSKLGLMRLIIKRKVTSGMLTLRAMSSSVANAAAGGLDPYGAMETKDLINLNSMKMAGMDIRSLNLNAESAILRGEANAQQARLAGDAAVRYAKVGAVANLATNIGDVMATGAQTAAAGGGSGG